MGKLQDQILDILSSSMDTASALAESNRIIAEAKTSVKPITYYTKDGKQFTLAHGKATEQQARAVPPAAKAGQAKEPWMMSRAEFIKKPKQKLSPIGTDVDFIRYGKPTEYSKDYSTGEALKGMSVYELDPKGASKSVIRGEFADRKDVYIGRDTIVGYGSDGEPLVSNFTTKKATSLQDEKAVYGGISRQQWLDKLASHKNIVQDALASGKPVPAEVLAEYKNEPWAAKALDDLAAKSKGAVAAASTLLVLSGAPEQWKARNQELLSHPNLKVATAEFSTLAAPIKQRENTAIDRLNRTFTKALGNRSSGLSAHQLNIRHAAIHRKYGKKLLDLSLNIFSKYGLGDVPVEEWRHREYWLDASNPKIAKLDRLHIQKDKTYNKLSDSVRADIKAAGGPSNLRYMKEGELDGFSDRTRELYREGKRLASQIAKLEGASPIETPAASLQSIESSRSDLSRTSDERQSHSLIVEPDDPRVSRWERDPGSMDIQGVDTPKRKSKYAVSKSGKTKKKRAAKGFTSLGTTR